MKAILFSSMFLLLLNSVSGQVTTNFNSSELVSTTGKFKKEFKSARRYTLPARDLKALIEKERLENLSGEPKPFKNYLHIIRGAEISKLQIIIKK